MLGLKSAAAAITVATMVASSALAAETAPLAPGKPAGVKQADLGSPTALVLIGFAVVAAIAIGVASSSNGSPVQQVAPTGTTTG